MNRQLCSVPARLAPYLSVLGARYRMLLQYRAAALAGAVTQFFWGALNLMVLQAFYRSSPQNAPISYGSVVIYVWLGQALLGLLPWNHDRELEQWIREGGVAFELLRPVDLYTLWYARTLASRLAATSLRCLPIVLVAGLVFPLAGLERWSLRPPPSLAAALAYTVALAGAVLLGCAITMLVHVSLLWTLSGEGMARVVPALVIVFSGMVVPLPLFPEWLQPLLAALPFRGLVDVPNRLYSGDIAVADGWLPVALTFLWTGALIVLGRMLLARGKRVLVLQGG